jgi:hypothetical protein
MTLLQLLARVKKVLLYEIAPRKLREPLSKRGPNISFTFSHHAGDEYRATNRQHKVLHKGWSLFD